MTYNFPVFEYEPVENIDWNYARTCRFLLRNIKSEFGLSTFSVPITITFQSRTLALTAPNRDFSYEGLLTLIEGENWKSLDCLAFGISGKEKLCLKPYMSEATSWFLKYTYYALDRKSRKGSVTVTYWLNNELEDNCLNVDFEVNLYEKFSDLKLLVTPFVDLRHIYDESNPVKHISLAKDQRDGAPATLETVKDGLKLTIYALANGSIVSDEKTVLKWLYKIGDGFRFENYSGVKFKGEKRDLFIPGYFQIPITGIEEKITIQALTGNKNCKNSFSKGSWNNKLETESNLFSTLQRKISLNKRDPQIYYSILLRADGLLRFGINGLLGKETATFPEAGSWWFRNIWMRDMYESHLANLDTLKRFDKSLKLIRNSLLVGLENFDNKTGRIPNRLPSKIPEIKENNYPLQDEYYYSADATLLFFTLFKQYVDLTGNKDLLPPVADLFASILQKYLNSTLDRPNGPPRIVENGLLACVPWHSWTDSKRTVKLNDLQVNELPCRIPKEWQLGQLKAGKSPNTVWHFFNTSRFLLPEINALWIQMLESMLALFEGEKASSKISSKISEYAASILESAQKNYLKVFWSEASKFLYDIVSNDFLRTDPTFGSPAVVAASILRNIIPKDKLTLIWNSAKKHLLTHRRIVWLEGYAGRTFPFGILTKNYSEKIYLDDEQYHGAVIWPRDTPYLIILLEFLDETEAVKGLLRSNLDHQMGEATIFYNNELFSLPQGVNPSPVEESKGNPVPVKNPVQLWSQWVDPYLRHEI